MTGARLLRAVAAICAVAISGCATLSEPQRGNVSSPSPQISACASWFRALDQAVDEAGVRDAGAFRVPGYPYLRFDRLLASFRGEAAADGQAFDAWLRRAREMDHEARRFETRNLPVRHLQELGVTAREQAVARSEACAEMLTQHDLGSTSGRSALVERAVVPDDYSDWLRTVGMYGLTRIPFGRGVERWHAEAVDMIRRTRDGTGPVRRYRRFQPPPPSGMERGEIARILSRSGRDALGIPRYSDADRDRLLAAYAPVYEIETTGDYDRFGALVWNAQPTPEVDVSKPAVYRRLTFTRYGRDTLTQLVYTIWFPERPREGGLDMLAGKLDGLVLRVTLGLDGAPLVYDTIHPCGCYHLFFPTPRVEPKPAPQAGEEWAFMPARLPALSPGQSVTVRIATRTHYLLDIAPDQGATQGAAYEWLEEDGLRSLSMEEGRWRSVYGPDGLVAGTERGERWFFWPMGIASSGAMRQWGRHATAFLGRRHFDDADLIERRFSRIDR